MASRLRLAALVAAAFALGPAPSWALTVSPTPLSVHAFDGASGRVELVDVVTGLPEGAVVSVGSVSSSAQTLVFRGRLDADSERAAGVLGIALRDATGAIIPFSAAGSIPGPAADLESVTNLGGEAAFLFTTRVAGTVFDLVFLAFDTPLDGLDGLRVDARLESGAGGTAVALVPEPATALLLLAGLTGLARRRR